MMTKTTPRPATARLGWDFQTLDTITFIAEKNSVSINGTVDVVNGSGIGVWACIYLRIIIGVGGDKLPVESRPNEAEIPQGRSRNLPVVLDIKSLTVGEQYTAELMGRASPGPKHVTSSSSISVKFQ